MANEKRKLTGRTVADLASELLARKSTIVWLAVIAWVLLAGVGYSWRSGKIAFMPNGTSKIRDVYIHAFPVVTKKMSNEVCIALTSQAYARLNMGVKPHEIHGAEVPPGGLMHPASVTQVGFIGSITSLITFIHAGESMVVHVVSAGPEDAATKDHELLLFETVKLLLQGVP
jgi:hypothetical protein